MWHYQKNNEIYYYNKKTNTINKLKVSYLYVNYLLQISNFFKKNYNFLFKFNVIYMKKRKKLIY